MYSRFIDIPSGQTVTIDVSLARRIEHPERIVTWVQPMANPLETLGSEGRALQPPVASGTWVRPAEINGVIARSRPPTSSNG